MASSSKVGASGAAKLLFVATALVGSANANLPVNICASLNTASMSGNYSLYQTNGLCHDFCGPQGYAYAITQINNCWCSDYVPAEADQVSTTKCNKPCPAWTEEFCGAPGLFAYLSLGGSPKGTKGSDGGSSASSTAAAATSSSTTPEATSSLSSSSTSSSTTDSSSMSSTTPSPTAFSTLTEGGTVKTVTIFPTGTTQPSSENTGGTVRNNGLSTGAIVGIVIGVVGGVLLLAALAFFLWRRKKQAEDEYRDDPSARGSSSGMRPEMSRAPGSPGSTGNRSSTLQIDPRMDPFQQGLYARSGSHESVNTLHDDHDYSRRIQQPKVLRATNPDPEHE